MTPEPRHLSRWSVWFDSDGEIDCGTCEAHSEEFPLSPELRAFPDNPNCVVVHLLAEDKAQAIEAAIEWCTRVRRVLNLEE